MPEIQGYRVLRDKWLISLIIIAILIKLFSLQPAWVERYYSLGFFVYSSQFLRTIFGWIPFSIGDILYLSAGLFLLWKFWRLLVALFRKRIRQRFTARKMAKYLKLALAVYVLFNLCWGLNYDRVGISAQLGLKPGEYSDAELLCLVETLHRRLNETAACVDTAAREKLLDNEALFSYGKLSYDQADDQLPFLKYTKPSVKSSLFSHLGHYFGFTGYINPFTNEAHLKTTLPRFVQLSILDHEIAHQVGYAKEDEASFVGFLAGRRSPSLDVRYSHYYDLFSRASLELSSRGHIHRFFRMQFYLHSLVRRDRRAVLDYYIGKRSRLSTSIEPFMSGFYNRYLMLNNQPKGKQTYNEVIALLIAYMNKYGEAAL